jgi:hypothetical protein
MTPPTIGPIEWFMTEDHVRISALLDRADAGPTVDADSYARFRHDLLRHIALEEKVLLPAARKHKVQPFPAATQLHTDHGAIAKLLVPTPTHAIIEELRELLARHNAIEEGPDGLYSVCDALLAGEVDAVLGDMRAYPAVPAAKHYDGPLLKLR